jgi:hypothetical protein
MSNPYDLDKMSFAECGLLVGGFGDLALQLLLGTGLLEFYGLKSYFQIHGSVESVCIAAGLMGSFSLLYEKSGEQKNLINLTLYGVALDLVFRIFRVMPSLEGYYGELNYLWSGIWGAIPFMMVYALYCYRNDKEIVLYSWFHN